MVWTLAFSPSGRRSKWAGVTEKPLDDVLGDALVDQSGPERVTELVSGDPH